MHGSGTLLLSEPDPTDYGSRSGPTRQRFRGQMATTKWTSHTCMFFRLALVPPALAVLLRRVAVGDMGRFFFGMTTTARANVRAAWRLNQDLLAGIQIPDCLSLVHACMLDTVPYTTSSSTQGSSSTAQTF